MWPTDISLYYTTTTTSTAKRYVHAAQCPVKTVSCCLTLSDVPYNGPALMFVLMCLQLSTKEKEEELLKMQEKYGVDAQQHPHKKAAPQ